MRINNINIRVNTRQEELELAKKLLKEYQKIGDKKNVAICKKNIKMFSK